ncbi:MAG: hypothetical protein ABSA16_17750 [Thermoguttaceae bacterium]|jgi:hypothetical protein
MKIVRLFLVINFLIVGGHFRPAWGGEVRPTVFLHALQKDYGDMAVDYLNMLKRNDDLPKELRESWDLEMSKSLRFEARDARDAYNAEESESLLREAEKHLAKFLREKPDHPEASEARAMLADFSMDKALKDLRSAQTNVDKKQKAKLLDDARTALVEARLRFKQAEEKYQAELDAMQPAPKRPLKRSDRDSLARREEIKTNVLNYRFQEALIDYYLAQTYASDSAERKAALQAAADAFDALFQGNRMETIGLVAHMWHGKSTEELGDWQTALDIYDEVLVNAPEPGQVQSDPALLALFAQVEHFRLQILAKQSPLQFMDEAGQWLQEYRKTRFSQTEGFQAIALDLVKAKIEAAENASGAEKSKLITGALGLLAEMSKVRSPYQQEAILLRRQYVKSGSKVSEPASFEEAVALGEAAAITQQWSEATANYGIALKLADKDKISQSQRKEAIDALVSALYMQARGQLISGKWEDCLATAERIFSDYKDSSIAPQAGSLAVSAALNLYSAAPKDKKAEALKRLKKYASLAEDSWPGRPEADDARMMLAQADLVQGKIDEALAGFEKIDPRSERYPNALLLAAETYWRRRLAEMEKPEGSRNKGQMDADLDRALRNLETGLKLQQKKVVPGEQLPRPLVETQLLLAEIKLGGGDAREAAALLQPLVDAFAAAKPEEADNVIVRIYAGAVRAYLALDDPEKALEIAMVLAEWGPDVQSVNAALVEVVKTLGAKRKQAEAAVAAVAGEVNSPGADEAREKLKSVAEMMNKLLAKMSSRKEFSIPATVYFADMCLAAGLPDVARDAYLRVANRAEKDPAYAKSAGKALQRVRAQLVDLLVKTGDYEEAYKQISQLAAANPRALDLLMTQGRILQSWSQRDASRYAEAVAHWARLRNMLLGAVKKPPEYFEITYNLAAALYGQAAEAKDKAQAAEKAKEAEKLLKSTLVLSPNLSGPEMVEQYNALLKKVSALYQRAGSR